MPEAVLKKLNTRILPQWKACFVASIVVGLLAHFYKITNWLPNWDSLVFRYDPQNMIGLGRWFLPVVCACSSFYDLPFLNGVIAILFHGLSAVCICKILNVQKKTTACLIGAVISSFPVVTSVMMYNYVADGYSISFFLATLAALFMTQEKPRYILSAVLIALSTGIYQAYITVTIVLVLFTLIDNILYHDEPFLVFIKKIIGMLLTGVLGVALYFVVLKVLLAAFSITLLDYQGINSTAALNGIDLAASFYVVKETFLGYFFNISNGMSFFVVLNGLILIATILYYVAIIINNQIYKSPVKMIILIILGLMLFIGGTALAFANAGVDYHNLMLMGYVIFYLFFLVLYERETGQKSKGTTIKCWTILIMTILLTANQVVIANVSYHKAQLAYEKSYGILMQIADRIEQTPGTGQCNRVLVLGALDDSEPYSVVLPPDMTGITDGYILRADDETVGQSVLCNALNDYCGKNYHFLSDEEKKVLVQQDNVKQMNSWPAKDSIAVIDNIIVIKLGTEGE
ncbi:MAG: glucosyltransferase domain-containing protein [Clostridia bacterium]|nr:glucosyltransferase domain-containing protein [Clostridia bacterium]